MKRILIIISGPTAIGKTALSLDLAEELNTSIISADSRQFFKEMQIGTAAPTADELARVPHHFVHSHSIAESYSAGQYERDVMTLLGDLHKEQPAVIMTGGSGLYIKAVTDGFDDLPDGDEKIRKELKTAFEEKGISYLQEELQRLDPVYFDQVDKSNHHRLLRAVEACIVSGNPFSSFRQGKQAKRPFETIKIALNIERELLYERINNRVDIMLEEGLEEEARSVYAYKEHNALRTVGYQEFFAYFDGEYDRDRAIELIKQNSRRYAKRQLTWLRRDLEYVWFSPTDTEAIKDYIRTKLEGLVPNF